MTHFSGYSGGRSGYKDFSTSAGGFLYGFSKIGFSLGKASENDRYWDDYYKNTGYTARYPLRSGYYSTDYGKAAGEAVDTATEAAKYFL